MDRKRRELHPMNRSQKSVNDMRAFSRFSLFLLVFVFAVSLAFGAYPFHASAAGEGGGGSGPRARVERAEIASLFTGAETLVDVNAESRFKGSAGFSKDVSVEGLLRGTEIDLGTGRITAGNIIYEVIGGDGILIFGDRQRPVVTG